MLTLSKASLETDSPTSASQGIPAAGVHSLDTIPTIDPQPSSPIAESAPSLLPTLGPIMSDNDGDDHMAPALAEDNEGVGQGPCPPLSPVASCMPAATFDFLQPSQGQFPANSVWKQVNFVLNPSPSAN